MADLIEAPHLYLVLWRSFRAVERFDRESVRRLGFGCVSDFAVLEVLWHKGPLPVKTIGEKVLLTSGSVTTAVERLRKLGWVAKERDEHDQRVVTVSLTTEGHDVIEAAFAAHAANLEALFAELSPNDREAWVDLLRRVGKRAASQAL